MPEDVALYFLVTDPAVLSLVSYHSPLRRTRHLFLVHQVPREYQLLVGREVLVLCRAILDNPLHIAELFDLYRLLDEMLRVLLQCGLT